MKKRIIILVVIVTLILLAVGGGIWYKTNQEKEKKIQEQIKKEKEILETIISNYKERVITTDKAKLYKLDGANFVEVGNIKKDVNILLEKLEEPNIENKYFKLKDLEYYVHYDKVKPNESATLNDDYKNYVPFDTDIVTKSGAKLYLDNNEIFTINDELQFAIIIKDTNYYHVEFNGNLVQIKKEDVSKTVENKKNKAIAYDIGVLNYHFFYDPANKEWCGETICLTTQKFEEQLKYLKDNDFYTATMKDMALWMESKIQLPKKTAVITVDDGATGTDTHLINLLEKYDLHGTLFLITAWWPKERYESDNLEIQSHGDNIHNNFGDALSKSKSQLLTDFKLSIDKLDGEKTAFCYPFYERNSTVISAVKESGFRIAFAGGNKKANQNNDPYQITRYVILNSITMNQFISMVN